MSLSGVVQALRLLRTHPMIIHKAPSQQVAPVTQGVAACLPTHPHSHTAKSGFLASSTTGQHSKESYNSYGM